MRTQNLRLAESLSFRENIALSAHRRLRVIRRTQEERTCAPILPSPTDSDDEMEHMTLSRIVEAPPHGEAEKVVKKVDTEVITEELSAP